MAYAVQPCQATELWAASSQPSPSAFAHYCGQPIGPHCLISNGLIQIYSRQLSHDFTISMKPTGVQARHLGVETLMQRDFTLMMPHCVPCP